MGSRQSGTSGLGVQWESGAGDVEAFRAVSRPGSGKHVVYAAARFCVKRAEGQVEAARSQRDSLGPWLGRAPRQVFTPGCLPGELQESRFLLLCSACLLLRKLNIVLTLKVHYLKEFHYWRAYIEGCIQR